MKKLKKKKTLFTKWIEMRINSEWHSREKVQNERKKSSLITK